MFYAVGVTILKGVFEPLLNPLALLGGLFMGFITYLIEPGAALFALCFVVLCDIVSRLFAEAAKHDGFFKAIKSGHIQSSKAFKGSAIKIVAYFIMCCIAAQSKYILPYETASELLSNVIYSILFFVEVLSITENFIDAGVEEFNWIRRFTKRKLEKIVDDGGEGGNNGPQI